MENLIIPLIATIFASALVLIVSLLFNMQKDISHLGKKIDVNNVNTEKQIGLINAKIDGLVNIIQKDSTNTNQRMERLENRFDSAVPLKVKTTKR